MTHPTPLRRQPECTIDYCRRPRGRTHLMCGHHWRLTPKWLREAVWSTYQEGQAEGLITPSDAWREAAEQARRAAASVDRGHASRIQGLTLRQPWASAIIAGPRRIENRLYRVRHLPRWIAIHAAQEVDTELDQPVVSPALDETPNSPSDIGGSGHARPTTGWDALRALWPQIPTPAQLPRSAILGLARIASCARYDRAAELHADPWARGPWCWMLDTVIALPEPIAFDGHQGFWALDVVTTERLRDAFDQARTAHREAADAS